MAGSALRVLWRQRWVPAGTNEPSALAKRARALWLESLPRGPVVDSSTEAVDVMIPVGPNDADVAALVVAGIRRNLRDPVASVTLVTQPGLVGRLASEVVDVDVVDETSVLTEEEVACVRGATRPHRTSWYVQQLVKLKWCLERSGPFTYVVDADTVLVRPQRLHTRRGDVVFVAQEYHQPYFDHLARLFGRDFRRPLFGTTVHQMLYRREWLRAMLDDIERANPGRTWIQAIADAIDPDELSGFSEGECYGQWVLWRRRRKAILRPFSNASLSRNVAFAAADPASPSGTLTELAQAHGARYDSVSLHYYLDRDPLPEWRELRLQA